MIVIDASISLGWVLPDEAEAQAREILQQVASHGAVVPAIWSVEVGNGLLMARRRKRLDARDFNEAVSLLQKLPIRIADPVLQRDFSAVLELAQQQQLTTYDASYLELAMRQSLPLATLDAQLQTAARKLRVPLVQ